MFRSEGLPLSLAGESILARRAPEAEKAFSGESGQNRGGRIRPAIPSDEPKPGSPLGWFRARRLSGRGADEDVWPKSGFCEGLKY